MSKRLMRDELELLRKSGYSEKAIELYVNMTNVGVIEDPDVSLSNTGPCGDTMKFYLRITGNGVIEDAKFLYLGCPGSATSGSALTEMVKGKTLQEAKRITKEDVLKELRGLPESKLHFAKLAVMTLQKTIAKYEEEKRRS